jgi:dTDP-4-dehydrorhamnose 3,5-epimerase
VHPLDPAIGIEWPTHGRDGSALTPSLSPKDAQAPNLADLVDSGVLPTYDDVQEFVDSLRVDL